MRSVAGHRRYIGWSARSKAIAVLLVSGLVSGCAGLAGVVLAPLVFPAAMAGGDLALRASYEGDRKSAAETGLASRTFAYPLLFVDEEVLPSVGKSHGWRTHGGNPPSCMSAVLVSRSSMPSPSAEAGLRVRVKCFYIGGPWPSSLYPNPSTVVVVSSVGPGDDEAARAFGVEILDALGAYLAGFKPQTADKVLDQDVAAVRAAIAKLSEGWFTRVDILDQDAASNIYRVGYRTPNGGRSVTMNIALAGVGSTTTVTVVGDASQSEGAFRWDAMLFLRDRWRKAGSGPGRGASSRIDAYRPQHQPRRDDREQREQRQAPELEGHAQQLGR
jgi:hypothetical protein